MDPELRHGYTIAGVQAIARSAAANSWIAAADFEDLMSAAWSAIVDELYTAEEPPSRHDLHRIAKGAVWDTARDYRRHHGYRNRDGWEGEASAPRFVAYWHMPNEGGVDERVAERVAIAEIFAALSGRERGIVLACVAHDGDYVTAAASLGMKRSAYHVALMAVRKKCAQLWHWPEQPHRDLKRYNRRKHRGEVAPHGTTAAVRRHRSYKETLCDLCKPVEREYDRARKAKVAGVGG
jgi:DNA-directed RNA polymerase specialized sigma24 family protein